jgi:hypothetical protein
MHMEEVSIDRLVKVYLKIRAAVQETQREFDEKIEALKAQQDALANEMKERIRAMGDGVSSLKTEHGTIMLSTKTRYYAQDWDAFKRFVIEREAVDLFEKRIAQKNMAAFLEENPGLTPPGLSSVSELDVSVRKASAR